MRTVLNGTRTHFIDGTSNRPGDESYRTAVSVWASRCQPDVLVLPDGVQALLTGSRSGSPSPCSTVTPGGCQTGLPFSSWASTHSSWLPGWMPETIASMSSCVSARSQTITESR
jgi:hypothetical protein